MEKNKRNKKRRNNWNKQKNNTYQSVNEQNRNQLPKFHYVAHENIEKEQRKQAAIRELKKREIICPKCGQPITDIASSMADKTTGAPMHFDCVMKQISESETLSLNERFLTSGRDALRSSILIIRAINVILRLKKLLNGNRAIKNAHGGKN